MFYPPSLNDAVKERAFCAANGELGVYPTDARSFLEACRNDGVKVLGWELWVIEHTWDTLTNEPVPAPGLWCGGIPIRRETIPAIIGGNGDVDATEHQLAAFDFEAQVGPFWYPYLRINFTVEG